MPCCAVHLPTHCMCIHACMRVQRSADRPLLAARILCSCPDIHAFRLTCSACVHSALPPLLRPCSTALLSVRADIAWLPFPSSSIDAVHAGAALHCWPDPAAGLAEICRVLRPGGVLVASTGLAPTVLVRAALGEAAAALAAKVFSYHTSGKNGFTLFEERRIAQLVAGAGLAGYSSTSRGMFVMFTATKPVAASSRG
eukprot:GHRQ01023018.1.p1 GENE.GHRQ01023018.1~~GHRQ01023018.1.p1  ORF type:complete len:198 (+),score=61.51 GHRQ01023018.1:377-970(+)